MQIIYDKNTGNIFRAIPEDQDYKIYYKHWGTEFVENLASVKTEQIPQPLSNYFIKNDKITKYTELEIEEKRLYGKILTEEERILEKLKPSSEEVRKAEETIKILTLIQEVI